METNIHTTTWNFRLLKKLLSQNLVVLVKLIVDGNWIYSFENISSSMFLAHCDTLKKYEHKMHWFGLIFQCCGIWSLVIRELKNITLWNYLFSPFVLNEIIWSLKATVDNRDIFTHIIKGLSVSFVHFMTTTKFKLSLISTILHWLICKNDNTLSSLLIFLFVCYSELLSISFYIFYYSP